MENKEMNKSESLINNGFPKTEYSQVVDLIHGHDDVTIIFSQATPIKNSDGKTFVGVVKEVSRIVMSTTAFIGFSKAVSMQVDKIEASKNNKNKEETTK